MKNFHIKSILLGMGMGVVLTSIISIIYFAGLDPKMSREEIIKQAEKYGMVQKGNPVNNENGTPAPKSNTTVSNEGVKLKDARETAPVEVKPVPSTSPSPAPAPAPATQKPAEAEVTIQVVRGDSSEVVADKIAKSGLINDKAVFTKEIVAMGLANEIDIGEYKIKQGTEVREIVKIVTRRK